MGVVTVVMPEVEVVMEEDYCQSSVSHLRTRALLYVMELLVSVLVRDRALEVEVAVGAA